MRKWGFAAYAAFVSLPALWGQAPVLIDSSEIRAIPRDGATVVSVPVSAASGARGTLSLEWADPSDRTVRSERREVTLAAGKSVFEVPLPLEGANIWWRLRYSLMPERSAPTSFRPQQGVLAISEIAAHVFELKIAHVWVTRRAVPLIVKAQALHPATRLPVEGVRWKAVLHADGKDVDALRVTPQEGGFVEFEFRTPATDDFDVEVSASLGDFKQDESIPVEVWDRPSARIQTDKPLYQPGQTVHARALIFDGEGRAAKGARVRLTVEDGDGETVHAAELEAGDFGVVQDEWALLPDAPAGGYRITITGEEDEYYRLGEHAIRVSRYDLPTFRVSAEPDRGAYLPGQRVEVGIRGSYLFGKPVPGGPVKVVRMVDGEDDHTLAEGRADAEGLYRAVLDVGDEFEDLTDEDRYKDLSFAAYMTDPASGKTEQRRFDVRITRQPIHIYVVRGTPGPQSPVYVATYYADGRPAVTSVEMRSGGRAARTRTNALGIGKAILATVDDGPEDYIVRAMDDGAAIGTWTERERNVLAPMVQMQATKTLYRQGESVALRLIAADEPGPHRNGYYMVNAMVEQRSVASRLVRLENGYGAVEFPYHPEFRGAVSFVAWNGGDTEQYARAQGNWTAIFPDTPALRVTAAASKSSYRPGEKASLRFSMRDGAGAAVPGVFGVAVVDQAVMERAATDADFGERPWFSCWYCERQTSVGSITLDQLTHLDWSKPLPEGLDLAAEMMMARNLPIQMLEAGDSLLDDTYRTFRTVFDAHMADLRRVLDVRYTATLRYPRDVEQLLSMVTPGMSSRLDPWDRAYSYVFETNGAQDVMEVWSSGPDQHRGTADDFRIGSIGRRYFLPTQRLIETVLDTREDAPASPEEFAALLEDNGIRLATLRDPWDAPYTVDVNTIGQRRVIYIRSLGPDGKDDTGDEVIVANFNGRYFVREAERMAAALRTLAVSPRTVEEFSRAMNAAGSDVTQLRDSWGNAYRVTAREVSEYNDRRTASTVRVYGGGTAANRSTVTPVTRTLMNFSVMSAGRDGVADTGDDFAVVTFPVILREESEVAEERPQAVAATGTGEIAGVITDATGASLAGAKVALSGERGLVQTVASEANGSYRFTGLGAGTYEIHVESPGFKSAAVVAIPVSANAVTAVDVVLEVGTTTESVTVTAEAAMLNTSMASVTGGVAFAIGTPRVREYFPETLLWAPALVTDAKGEARLDVPLADSVTTWKVAVIASTEDGRVAEAAADVLAFQPFFLDFDPPAQLTEGDRVVLPVTVRNYTKRTENVSVSMQGSAPLPVGGSASAKVKVAADASANASFTVRAAQPTERAALRVGASGGGNRDAIERRLAVRPDGQEVTRSFADLIGGPVSFAVPVPENAIAGATRGEVRVYPGVFAALLESARALVIAPHGCAEQTISAGYANLIALRYARAMGTPDPAIEREALGNIRDAMASLSRYRQSDGGIRYWATGEADAAVTAYAVRFLADALAVTAVDREQVAHSINWLVKHQAGGQWQALVSRSADGEASLLLTSLVVRSLAAAQRAGELVPDTVLTAGYSHVAAAEVAEPYVLAQFVLAALDSGDDALAADAVTQLLRSAREERGTLYWDLRTNTPFYGWGTPGRIETTAAVVTALAKWKERGGEVGDAVRRGSVFLLRQRDRDGAWFSTQATVLTMEALASAAGDTFAGKGGSIEVRVNGRVAGTVRLPDDGRFADALRLDVSALLRTGDNRVELIPSAGVLATVVQMPVTHWLRWSETAPRQSSELRYGVTFDKLDAAPGELVRCTVQAERVGFRGYGMMLAEVGLPPGADVDRASLQDAVEAGRIDRYEVQPDRVVLYLWPRAGGASLDFFLRTRFPMTAKSRVSVLYDYYNPEALTEVAPVTFR